MTFEKCMQRFFLPGAGKKRAQSLTIYPYIQHNYTSVFSVHIFESLHSLHKSLSVYNEDIFESLHISCNKNLLCHVHRFVNHYNTYSDIYYNHDNISLTITVLAVISYFFMFADLRASTFLEVIFFYSMFTVFRSFTFFTAIFFLPC